MAILRNLCSKIKVAGLFIFLIFCAGTLFAQEVEEAEIVPEGLSKGEYEKLLNQKNVLDKERDLLLSDINKLNADCSQVPVSDKAKVKACQKRHDLIIENIDRYEKRLQAYSTAILQAQAPDPSLKLFKNKGDK